MPIHDNTARGEYLLRPAPKTNRDKHRDEFRLVMPARASYRGKRLDQRAGRIGTRSATLYSIRQHALHGLQIGNPCPHIVQMRGGEFPHFPACFCSGTGQTQQFTHLIQGKPQLPRAPNEDKAANVGGLV